MFRLRIPPNLQPGAPVVVQLHGAFGSIEKMEDVTGLPELGDVEGFIVATPLGLEVAGGNGVWNAGTCCGASSTDHVAALFAVIDRTLELSGCGDLERVFVAGQSNGAMMAYRLACEASDRVAGVIASAGYLANETADGPPSSTLFDCTDYQPVSILHVHGLEDPIVSYDGNEIVPSIESNIDSWRARNRPRHQTKGAVRE